MMAHRDRCRECRQPNSHLDDDGRCPLCVAQLMLPLRNSQGRYIRTRHINRAGGAR
jgi:hypothetical protein